jgi:hypothetical protein
MSVKSNLYAEKIFAEHPTGLWALDDNVDYLSLISSTQRNIVNWDFSEATVTSSALDFNKPFVDSILNQIQFDNFVGSSKEIKFIGPDLIDLDQLNFDLATLTSGCYMYTESAYLKSISIGFEYNDTSSGDTIEKVTKYTTDVSQKWIFLSHTSTFPNQSTSFRPILKIEFNGGALSTDSYKIFTNGFSIAQCSENFNTTSLGITLSSLPTEIALTGIDGAFPASPYVPGIKNGYYLIKDNKLLSKNTSVPMVYGSDSITKLVPNLNNPSLIIPGLGFLNETGKYQEYTVEMWMRINCDSVDPLRIFGPIGSTDGLYVEDGFISLVIGKYFASHYIGEWYRPMLIQIKMNQNNASLIINGEQVISLDINLELLDLPSEFNGSDKELDWLGFYSYENANPYEVDCIAIYSYLVPDLIAKKRWVYGQAVISPETINSAYGASSIYIDYPYSEYTANYTYPNIGNWSQATLDNVSTTEKTLSVTKHSLPSLFLDNKTEINFIDDNKFIQDESYEYFTFRPNSTWNNKKTYAYFDNFYAINEDIHGLSAVIKFDTAISNVQSIFTIYDINNNNYFKATLENTSIKYYFYYNESLTTLQTFTSISPDTYLPIGFELEKMIDYFGSNLGAFFGNKNSLKVYIGSNQNGLENFEGKFYKFHIFSNYNVSLISSHFSTSGLCTITAGANFLNHTSTYTLIPVLKYDNYYLDIASAGYWEDYIPLSYFASYIDDVSGQKYYDLDLLQFNIDYPSPTVVYSTEQTASWDYGALELAYDHTVQRTYAQLDNSLFSGWQDYEDIEQKSIKTYFYNTDNSSIRSYISFQYISSGANKNFKDFSSIQPIKNDKILNVSNFTNWQNTVFEVADNTIVYPPIGIDFNTLAIVVHLVFNIQGTQHKNITLKKLELASQAFDHNAAKKIGTRFGLPIYPYKKTGIYFDYKAKNPISIFKESVPYLYSTRKSGIEVRGSFSPFVNRGIGIPLNRSNSNDYKISAIQMWLRYDFDKFTYGATQVFELEHKNNIIQFFISAVSENGDRGKIFAINKSTGQEVNGLAFYINGSLVREPIVETKEWTVFGVSFANSLNLDNFLGYINLNGPFVFNSITNYQSTELQEIQSKIYRPWLKVKNDGISNLFWSYWYTSYNWNGVLVTESSELYGVDPSEVYKTYIGRNKVVVDSNTSESLNFTADSIKIFTDASWQTRSQIPV